MKVNGYQNILAVGPMIKDRSVLSNHGDNLRNQNLLPPIILLAGHATTFIEIRCDLENLHAALLAIGPWRIHEFLGRT